MEILDRPTTLPITHDPNLSDKVMYLQMAFKQRPLRDGGGKPFWTAGRVDSATVQSSSDGGQDLCPHVAMGDGPHPFLEDLLEDIRAPKAGRPTLLFSELLRSTFLEEIPMGREDGPLTKVARSAPSTMARWAGPMTPSGTRRWKGRRLDGVQALHPAKPPPKGWLWPEPGTRWVLLKADAHRRVIY